MEIFVCSSGPIPWIDAIKLDAIEKNKDEEDRDLEADIRNPTMMRYTWDYGSVREGELTLM